MSRGVAGRCTQRRELTVRPGAGIFGNSHGFVVEKNNLQIADLISKWLAKNVDHIKSD